MGFNRLSISTSDFIPNLVANIIGGILVVVILYTVQVVVKNLLISLALSLLMAIAWLAVWFYFRYYHSTRKLRKGLSGITRALSSKRPDLIIAFNRSGGIIAGMLAANLRDSANREDMGPQVIVLNRCRSGDRWQIGSLADLDASQIEGKRVLIAFMVILGGGTLEAGLDYLENMGIKARQGIKDGIWQIASIYITPWSRGRIQKDYGDGSIIWIYETPKAQESLDKVSWLLVKPYPSDWRTPPGSKELKS